MNHLGVLLSAFLAFSANNYSSIPSDNNEWAQFKLEHNKSYENSQVETLKQAIYAHNKKRVDDFHLEDPQAEHYQLKLNHLADLGDMDMMQINGFRPELSSRSKRLNNPPRAQAFLERILADSSMEVPDSLDWRQVEGRVSSVKNQGFCGSCWAFASAAVLEGQEATRRKFMRRRWANATLTSLSAQNLIDCVKTDFGCKGGIMEDALNFVNEEGGIDDEASYPYEESAGKCRFKKANVVISDQGCAILPTGDEQKLKEVVAKFGPVAVAIDASGFRFQFYHKGVFINKHCKNRLEQLDHAVLVVGYGTDPKQGDYWIVKNSWGPRWGEKGYIRMARNRNNMCGIATVATIPTF